MLLAPMALILAGVIFSIGWLLPNHYAPWLSFWQDFCAALAFMIIWSVGIAGRSPTISVPWLALGAAGVATIPLVQWLVGQVFFFGDAFIVFLYLIGFALAVSTPVLVQDRAEALVEPLILAILLASIASVGLALFQFFSVEGLSIFMMDMSSGGRPYANLAQPNQLATLLLLGIVATFWLVQRSWLGRWGAGLAISWLCLGLAMTQSRTAWAAMSVLVCWLLSIHGRADIRINRGAILATGLGFGLLVLVWPSLCDWLYLSANRSLADQSSLGLRAPLWRAMLDAISREPWVGYGWNQVSVAQFRVATAHSPMGQWFEDSHNLILELLLSNGLPIGILITLFLSVWLWRHAVACTNALVGLAIGGILVVGPHAMVEFPLDYAYFLLPVGLLAGLVEAKSPVRTFVVLPRMGVIVVGVVAAALLGRVAYEYSDVEQRNRDLRFEMAGFAPLSDGRGRVTVRLVTQLEALPKFAQMRARRDMPHEELVQMRVMAERYSFPPVIFRYALATALNGDLKAASAALTILCHIHPPERCAEGIDVWRAMSNGDYPELKQVHLPRLERNGVAAPQTLRAPIVTR